MPLTRDELKELKPTQIMITDGIRKVEGLVLDEAPYRKIAKYLEHLHNCLDVLRRKLGAPHYPDDVIPSPYPSENGNPSK